MTVTPCHPMIYPCESAVRWLGGSTRQQASTRGNHMPGRRRSIPWCVGDRPDFTTWWRNLVASGVEPAPATLTRAYCIETRRLFPIRIYPVADIIALSQYRDCMLVEGCEEAVSLLSIARLQNSATIGALLRSRSEPYDGLRHRQKSARAFLARNVTPR